MLDHPVDIAVLLGAAVLLGLVLWSVWTGRNVDFMHRVTVHPSEDADLDEVLDQVVPTLVRDGFRMVAGAGHTTVFERRSSIVGPLVVSVVLFPIGLIALLMRSRETITFVNARGTLDLYGRCSKPTADYLIAAADAVAAAQQPA